MTTSAYDDLVRVVNSIGAKMTMKRADFDGKITQAVHSPRVKESLKKEMFQVVKSNQGKMQNQILRGLLGNAASYTSAKNMTERIKRIQVYDTESSRRARSFINKPEWAGNWYKYKMGMTTRRLHSKDHSDGDGHREIRTAASYREAIKHSKRKESEFSAKYERMAKTGRTPMMIHAEFNKDHYRNRNVYVDDNLRTTSRRTYKRGTDVSATPSSYGPRNNLFDELGKVKADLADNGYRDSHATARSVLVGRHLNKERSNKIGYSTSRNKGRRYNIPYVSTGILATQLSKSFEVVGVNYVNNNKTGSRFDMTMQYKLDLGRLPGDVKEAWIYSQYRYKAAVISGTNEIAEEYLAKVLADRFGKKAGKK